MIYKTHAIILSSTEVKEYDRFYNIFSSDYGKKTIIAKGVRKINAKLASGLEPITYSEIFLAEGRTFDRVTGVIIHNQFKEIKNNLAKIQGIRKFFRIVDQLLIEKSLEKQENQKLFEELILYLELMNKKKTSNLKSQLFKMAIIWKMIYWLGFQPQIFNCAYCSKKLKEQTSYQIILPSGIVCQDCFRKIQIVSQKQKISKEILKILRVYNQKNLQAVSRVEITSTQCDEIRRLTVIALGHILGKRVDL